MAPLDDLKNKPLPGRRSAKPAPQQGAAGASAPTAAVACPPPAQQQHDEQQQQQQQQPQQQSPQQQQPDDLGLQEVDEFLRSFRRLDFAAAPEGGAGGGASAEGGDASLASSAATASSSRLGSPLAAFAAAKARLERNTHEADGLICSALQRLGQAADLPPPASPAPDAATPRGGGPAGLAPRLRPALDPSLMVPAPRVPLQRPARAGGGGSPGGALAAAHRQRGAGGNQLLQHQRQHSLLLHERLRSTMQLCQSLHQQVGEGRGAGVPCTVSRAARLPARPPP